MTPKRGQFPDGLGPPPRVARWLAGFAAAVVGCSASEGPCREADEAQAPLGRTQVLVGEVAIDAEIARTPTEWREAWAFRQCELEGLILVPDATTPVPALELCHQVGRLDAAAVESEMIVEVLRDLEPCRSPCDSCPVLPEAAAVDAVVVVLADTVPLELGAPVLGVPAD